MYDPILLPLGRIRGVHALWHIRREPRRRALCVDGVYGDELPIRMERFLFAAGAVAALLGVALGAFGAHALRDRLTPELLAVFETGVRYHFYHAFALLAAAYAASRWPEGAAAVAGWLFLAGIVLFSGSLYLLALTGVRWLGAITPLGGIAFIAGWAALTWTALATSRSA